MLSDRFLQLLTAYVDGELNGRQGQAVERLLARSAEARDLLKQLQEDAGLLRSLPRPRLGEDFSPRVLRAIADRRLQPSRRARLARAPAFPAWAGFAAAAAVLLVVGLSTYVYFVAANKPGPDRPAVAAQKDSSPAEPDPDPDPLPVVQHADQPPDREIDPDLPAAPPPAPVVQVPKDQPLGPVPVPPAETPNKGASSDTELAIQNPTPKMEVFEKVDLHIALSLSLRDLDQEKARQRLRDRVKKENALRLELACLGNGKGFERLQESLKAQGLKLLIDPVARGRLKNPRLKTDYVLYSDDLTPDELTRVLEHLGQGDKAAEAKKRNDGQFGLVVVNQLTPADHAKLSELLGADPTQLQSPKAIAPLGVDIRKPLSESTAEKVAQAAAGQGPPKSAPDKPAPGKAPERLLLVLAYNPVRSKPGSKEVQQFLAGRKDRRAGAVQVLLFLRGANG
jgi:hypothetical protein